MRSTDLAAVRFYGWTENKREEQMDMREMVEKVKRGESLYGTSALTPYMQGVAVRNSRYSSLMFQIMPWANFVNHNQVSVRGMASEIADNCASTALTLRNTINKLSENSRPSGQAGNEKTAPLRGTTVVAVCN